MAKRRALALAPRPSIVVVSPPRRGGLRRRAGRSLRRVARRGVRNAGRSAIPTLGITLGGAAVGYLKGSGRLDVLPVIGGSRMVTLGLAGWAATRFIRNPHIRTAGIAAMAAAAFDFGQEQAAGGTRGDDEGWGWDT